VNITIEHQRNEILQHGFTILNELYNTDEVDAMIEALEQADQNKATFRKSTDLFAIRQCLKEIPSIVPLVFNDRLKKLINDVFGQGYFVVKSIYFDKPETSNWYVAYHQDLTISVDKKIVLENYGPWTSKHNQYAVQPPISVLENIFTIRIHLDDTNEHNGALRVLPGSHAKQIYRPEDIDYSIENETTCSIDRGGIMLMKPLLLHSSNRTTNNQKRRVIHIEFCNQELPPEIRWAERLDVFC
jgi:ectoine hydroxylase-related dioxygenase (phytanoyl-CoA dioxygenase family)